VVTSLWSRAISVYDRLYRVCHRLDREQAAVAPVLRVEVRRVLRGIRLSDGIRLRLGDRVGVLHLDNHAVANIHADDLSPLSIGLEFRRQFLESLATLAALAQPGGRFVVVRAFTAVTIFHQGLQRLGFELEPDRLVWAWLTTAYQRRLLALLHPGGASRLQALAARRAERLWISRQRLLALYGRTARLGRPAEAT
jgi:hypothetical protein